MLVLDMIYVDWIVKKEKSIGILRRLSHALDSLGFGAWQLWYQSLDYDSINFENRNWFWSKLEH